MRADLRRLDNGTTRSEGYAYWYRQWSTGYGPNYAATPSYRGIPIKLGAGKTVQNNPGLSFYNYSNWILADNATGASFMIKGQSHSAADMNVLFVDGRVKLLKAMPTVSMENELIRSKMYNKE